jgi:hypothetical protein
VGFSRDSRPGEERPPQKQIARDEVLRDRVVRLGYRITEVQLDDRSPIKENVKIKILRINDPLRRPTVAVSCGMHCQGAALCHADPTDVRTLCAGVRKRFAYDTPKPNPATLKKCSRFMVRKIFPKIESLAASADTTLETWLPSTSYPEWRRNQLLRINREFYNDGTNRKLRRLYNVNGFCKDESYTSIKHARIINSRSDVYKTLTGPIFRLIEKALYCQPAFIKKIPLNERADYIRNLIEKSGVKYIATDYTCYEAHFSKQMMESIEFKFYEYMVRNLPEKKSFMDLVRHGIAGRNKIRINNLMTVEIDATRMSGEMNTSLGNGFTNWVAMLYLCHVNRATAVTGVVEGDDGLFSMYGRTPTAEQFKDLGFAIKLEEFDRITDASFCGLVFHEHDMQLIADPMKALLNFGWTTSKYRHAKNIKLLGLQKSKALSLLYQFPTCPILTNCAKYALRVLDTVKSYWAPEDWWQRNQAREVKLFYYRNPHLRDVPIGQGTRHLIERLYRISITDQLVLEKYFEDLDTVTHFSHPALCRYYTQDQIWSAEYIVQLHPKEDNFPAHRFPEHRCLLEVGIVPH